MMRRTRKASPASSWGLYGPLIGMGAVMALGLGFVVREISEELNDFDPAEGTVVAKEYRDDYTYPICTKAGKVNVCTQHRSPECWQLTLEFDGRSGDVCVTQAVYLDSEVGDYVNLRTA